MQRNINDSGNLEDGEASEMDVDTDTAEAVTDGGQPLALEERLDGEMTIRKLYRTNSDTFGGRYVERG